MRPRATQQLPLTRNHLYALGALSVALAVLSFFVGFQTGRGKVVAPPPPPIARFVPDEVAQGDLEVLLAGVEQATAGDVPLGFPDELPRTEVPVVPPTPLEGAAVGAPVPAAPPAPNPFPAEARPGTIALTGGGGVVTPPAADMPTSGWAIQVAEHAVEADADRYVETLQQAGLSAYKAVALVEGRSVWRVRVGGYASKDGATAALSAVSSKAGAAKATVTPAP